VTFATVSIQPRFLSELICTKCSSPNPVGGLYTLQRSRNPRADWRKGEDERKGRRKVGDKGKGMNGGSVKGDRKIKERKGKQWRI